MQLGILPPSPHTLEDTIKNEYMMYESIWLIIATFSKKKKDKPQIRFFFLFFPTLKLVLIKLLLGHKILCTLSAPTFLRSVEIQKLIKIYFLVLITHDYFTMKNPHSRFI